MKALRVSGYVILAPLGAAVSLTAAGLALSRATPAATRYVPLAVGAFLCGGSALAWLHQFR